MIPKLGRIPRVAVGVTLAVSSVSALAFSQIEWTQLHSTTSPSGQTEGAMTYDSARSRAVYYGGFGSISETWEWDGIDWRRLAPMHLPPARPADQLAFDSARGRSVLFGGGGIGGTGFNDTWEWDGADWVRMLPTTIPTERWDFALAYDSGRQRTVMFGGSGAAGFLAETLEWDGLNWLVRTPAHSPSPRANHRLAYDASRARTVLFGGADSNQVFGDTWEWTGDDWIPMMPAASPPPHLFHSLAYDAARQRTVLFGGADRTGIRNEAWEWDGTTWTVVATARRPSPRYLAPMTYDSSCARILLFGGANSTTLGLTDTWVLSAPPTATVAIPSLGAESGGELVEIQGAGFTEAPDTSVTFGGVAATIRRVECARLLAVAPPGSGTVDVTVTNSLGATTLSPGFTYVSDDVAARFGNVNAGRGVRENPLLVNGNVGNIGRELTVRVGEPLDAFVTVPSTRIEARYVVYAWLGIPNATTLTPLPRGLGATVFPTPFAGTSPQPRAIWNNVGRFARLGTPTSPSSAAPSFVFRRSSGARVPAMAALQGLIQDDGSLSPDGFSVTNAIVLHIVP